jgi:hypothetical protein
MGLIMNKKVMVNNPTNINKTNNHLSFQTFEPKKKTSIYGIGNPGLGLVHQKKLTKAL